MDRFEEIRRQVLPVLIPWGIKRLSLFGSMARGDEGPDSDVDLLIDFEEPRPRPMGLMTWARLERELRERLGRNVDLVPRAGLRSTVRPYVEAELITLYEKA